MFRTPNQTGQRKLKETALARNTHPPTTTRNLTNPNRKPKLLETLQLQQNKPGSGLMIQPGDINGRALIAKKPMFSPSILKHFPKPDGFRQCVQSAPAIALKSGKREENANPYPSILLRLKGGPIVYFDELTDGFNRTMLRLKRGEGGKDLRSAGVPPALTAAISPHATSRPDRYLRQGRTAGGSKAPSLTKANTQMPAYQA